LLLEQYATDPLASRRRLGENLPRDPMRIPRARSVPRHPARRMSFALAYSNTAPRRLRLRPTSELRTSRANG
jgi:hypothetical protein